MQERCISFYGIFHIYSVIAYKMAWNVIDIIAVT